MALTEQAVIAAEGLMLQSTTGQKHPDHRSPGGTVRIHEITAAVLEQGAEVKDVFSGWAVHCKDPAVQSAILNGQVFWSQLDGESWLSFRGR